MVCPHSKQQLRSTSGAFHMEFGGRSNGASARKAQTIKKEYTLGTLKKPAGDGPGAPCWPIWVGGEWWGMPSQVPTPPHTHPNPHPVYSLMCACALMRPLVKTDIAHISQSAMVL